MTRTKCFLLALALAGPGCLSPLTHLDEPPPKTPPVQVMMVPPPPPVVTADEVTEANAGEKARALARELDFAANEHSATAAKAIATNP